MNRDDGLRLLALLVVLTLATQGVSTAVKRLWMPAHYHLPVSSVPVSGATTATGHGHSHGQPREQAEPVVRHPWRGHGWFQDRDDAASQLTSLHAHPDEPLAAHDAGRRANTHTHSHPGIGHHRHDRGTAGVVYVADADGTAPLGTLSRAEVDNFWGDLPPRPSIASSSRRGDPPPPPPPLRLARADEAPLRPPC